MSMFFFTPEFLSPLGQKKTSTILTILNALALKNNKKWENYKKKVKVYTEKSIEAAINEVVHGGKSVKSDLLP